MNFNTRKNLLLFSLAAETFLGSYGLLLGQQTTIVSILYLIASLCFILSILLLQKARLPSFRDCKRRFLSEMAFVRVDVCAGILHIPVLDGSDSIGSGFCGHAPDNKSDERKVSER